MVVRLSIPNARRTFLADVDFDGVKKKAFWMPPVPGCAGSITETMLIKYAFSSAHRAPSHARAARPPPRSHENCASSYSMQHHYLHHTTQ